MSYQEEISTKSRAGEAITWPGIEPAWSDLCLASVPNPGGAVEPTRISYPYVGMRRHSAIFAHLFAHAMKNPGLIKLNLSCQAHGVYAILKTPQAKHQQMNPQKKVRTSM
jgi:hypothetical protein